MKELAVGIVGAASRGRSFFAAFGGNPHTRITALCDINEEGLASAASESGVSSTFASYEEMLDRARPDIVVVATPMQLHVPQAIMALDRGIHVLSEVTAAVSIEEAKELVQTCKKSSGRYMMGENYNYVRHVVLVLQIARAGLFGETYFGEGEYVHELKGLNEITKWRRKWHTGINGNTYPTHCLGPLLEWMDDRVVSVSCVGTGHHYQDPRGDHYENEDSTFMACRMSKGGLVNIRLDMLSNRPPNMNYLSLQGTKGCYESGRGFGDHPKIWLESRCDHEKWIPPETLEEEFLPAEWLHPPKEALEASHWGSDYMEVQDFVRAIVEDREMPVDIHRAMDYTLPGLMSQLSIEQGSVWLEVPDSREW